MKVYLSLGSNLGNREEVLLKACQAIALKIGKINKKSSIFETQAWGYTDTNSYLNIVIELKTKLPALKILSISQGIERSLGRKSKTKIDTYGRPLYASRQIDIDILFIEQQIINEAHLIVPHLHLHKRAFVLEPLCEIAPQLMHPILKKTIAQILSEFEQVKK